MLLQKYELYKRTQTGMQKDYIYKYGINGIEKFEIYKRDYIAGCMVVEFIIENNNFDVYKNFRFSYSGSDSVEIDWGDGVKNTNLYHTYNSVGTYIIQAKKNMAIDSFYTRSKLKILSFINDQNIYDFTSFYVNLPMIGEIPKLPSGVYNLYTCFANCPNLTCEFPEIPNMVNVMSYAFDGSSGVYGNIKIPNRISVDNCLYCVRGTGVTSITVPNNKYFNIYTDSEISYKLAQRYDIPIIRLTY